MYFSKLHNDIVHVVMYIAVLRLSETNVEMYKICDYTCKNQSRRYKGWPRVWCSGEGYKGTV